MKPEDICKVDYEGKQLAGTRKRTSEVLLHLAVYKNRPDVQGGRPLPSAACDRVRRRPRADPEVRAAGGRGLPRRGADRQVRDAGRSEVAEHDRALREGLQHDPARQSRHGDVGPDRREGLLQHRDHRRLLPDPDPGQAARPRQLLQRAGQRRSCWSSRSGSATTTRASRRATASCAAPSIFSKRLQRLRAGAVRVPPRTTAPASSRATNVDTATRRRRRDVDDWCRRSPTSRCGLAGRKTIGDRRSGARIVSGIAKLRLDDPLRGNISRAPSGDDCARIAP